MGNVVNMHGPKDGDFGPDVRIDVETGEILDENDKPTGRTLEDLTDEYVPPFALRGAQQQLDLSLEATNNASSQVLGSMLKVRSGTYPILGQYRIGEKVVVELEVEVEDVQFKAVRTSHTREIIGIDRIHTGTIEGGRTVT